MFQQLVIGFFITLSLSASQPVNAQTMPVSYGRISLKVNELWSKRVQQDRMILDNHNIQGEIPATLIIYPFQQTSTDVKEHSALAFRKYLALSDTATVPRPKKLYNEDAIPFSVFAMDKPTAKPPHYSVLYVFSIKEGYQPILVQTNNQGDFRKIQADMLQTIQAVRIK